MRIWQIVLPGILGLALAGCHSDPRIEALERDNWKKEQEIYRLRYENKDLKAALEDNSPVQRDAPRAEMPIERSTTEGSRTAPAKTRPGPSSPPPERSYAEPDASPPGEIHVSPGMEVPSGQVPERMRIPPGQSPSPSGPTPSFGPPAQWSPVSSDSLSGDSVLADNRLVAQITLHPALTGGIGVSERRGDEGLLVVVEPRDFGGNQINAPGDVSVALLDPALPGEQARLARWDFSAAQAQGMIRGGSQPGIHLRLPWNSAPAHDRLKVFVRYTTRDGRKLQAERLISVALSGSPPARREAIPDDVPEQTASRPQRPQWSPVR